ncbi:MAG: GNAT family N-acetyltransferase [Patescibacteria group bacterium]
MEGEKKIANKAEASSDQKESKFEENLFDYLVGRGLLLSIADRQETTPVDQTKKNQALVLINSLPFDYFFKKLLPELEQNSQRHLLPPEIVEAIISRGLSLIEDRPEAEQDLLAMDLNCALQLHGDFKRDGSKDESIADKTFKAVIKTHHQSPSASRKFFQYLFQDPQTIRPDIFIEGLVDLICRPDTDADLESEVLHGLNYAYSFFSELYDQVLVDNLDFSNSKNFSRTAVFLEFIRRLCEVSQDYSFSEKAGSKVIMVLKEAIEKNEGSYFLKMRAQEIYNHFEKGELLESRHNNRRPFILSGRIYAWESRHGLYVADESDFDEICRLNQEIDSIEDKIRPPQHLIDLAIANGETEVFFSPDSALLYERNQLFRSLESFFSRKLSVTDVFIPASRSKDESRQREEALVDFKWMSKKSMREKIGQELNIDLSNLSLREQFHFLQFIKTMSSVKMEPVRRFASRFGLTGFKTFLSCEYGQEMGNKILELGERLPPAVAEKIFAKYVEIIETADETIELVAKEFGRNIPGDVLDKVRSSLLSRGRDVLNDFCLKAARGFEASEILDQMDSIKADVLLFAASFRALLEAGEEIDFKEAAKVSMETRQPADLLPSEKEEMIRIFLANREDYPEELLREVSSDFEEAVSPEEGSAKSQSVFTILRYDRKIICFLRLEPRGQNRLYAASFNVRPEAQGFKIGNAMIKEVIDSAARENIIEAVVYGRRPELLDFYKSRFGFKEVGETEIAGEKFVVIERNDLAAQPQSLAAAV